MAARLSSPTLTFKSTLLLLIACMHILADAQDVVIGMENWLEVGRLGRGLSAQVELDPIITQVVALEWDASHTERIFFSATYGQRASILAFNLTDNSTALLISNNNAESAEGIAYDPLGDTLYWTDRANRTLNYVNISEGDLAEAKVLHRLRDGKPSGLAIDICRRHIYWSNVNQASPSIDQSDLDGGPPSKLVTSDIFQPRGITIDPDQSRLYWVDNRLGIHFRVEYITLDGSQRALLYRGEYQNPFGIAVSGSKLMWTDWSHKAVWEMGLDDLVPRQAFNFSRSPFGIVARKERPICQTVKVTVVHALPEDNETELDACEEVFCLNGGRCRVGSSGDAGCDCTNGFTGWRCQELRDCPCQNGRSDAAGDQLGTHCSCNESSSSPFNKTPNVSQVSSPLDPGWIRIPKGLFGVLVGATVSLLVTSVVLAALLVRQRRGIYTLPKRTKIDKPNRSAAACSIDIEDCCNMNICETPCYETGVKYQRSAKADDQTCLLLPPKDST